jgi:penicillin-binding protein 1A
LALVPDLPPTEHLREVPLQVPLRVYASTGQLIAEFGEVRRVPVKLVDVPEPMIKAVLAAEDDRFYTHPGVDYQGLLRASFYLLTTGEKKQGGSTITMQVARNFFLGSEKTYLRKLKEILLALKIESELSKDEILELYLNKIYLGNRSYGVVAAAQFYYGTPLDQLNVAQMAMIAGLPKAPSKYNPIANLARATERRNYVLERMNSLGYLEDSNHKAALATPETAKRHAPAIELEAPYVAEMVRAELVKRYGDKAYSGGFKVVTTLDATLQTAADAALRTSLIEYDMRHGYRKPKTGHHVDVQAEAGPAQWKQALVDYSTVGGLLPALVIKLETQRASVYHPRTGVVEIPWAGMAWARPYIDENKRGPAPKSVTDVLAVGDIIRIAQAQDGQWRLTQIPAVQGAFISLMPANGAINSLVGGFYFYRSSFNRVLQAERQPGSSFKPFLYSASLEKGFTPATVVNDAPVVVEGDNEGELWRPHNYGGKFNGPTRLRDALTHSRNLVSIRVLRAIGIDYAVDYIANFGFKRERLQDVDGLSLALGSSVNTPLELAGAYAVFANGGYRVDPYFIERIEGPDGEVLMQARPVTLCQSCAVTPLGEGTQPVGMPANGSAGSNVAERVISLENAYLMTSMMQDVIRKGTATRAMQLGRKDLAGKTGTTNDIRDAWFAGFNSDVVAVSWIGFDEYTPLGDTETGGKAALPMWIYFMQTALKGKPEKPLVQPAGIITARVDPNTGHAASANDPGAITEFFSATQLPDQQSDVLGVEGVSNSDAAASPSGQLF